MNHRKGTYHYSMTFYKLTNNQKNNQQIKTAANTTWQILSAKDIDISKDIQLKIYQHHRIQYVVIGVNMKTSVLRIILQKKDAWDNL